MGLLLYERGGDFFKPTCTQPDELCVRVLCAGVAWALVYVCLQDSIFMTWSSRQGDHFMLKRVTR
jgi:hypothetical protein